MSKKENKMELQRLSEVPLFRSLPIEEIDHLVKSYRTWDAPIGAFILHEGEASDEFHVIIEGQVEIIRSLGSAEEFASGDPPDGRVYR